MQYISCALAHGRPGLGPEYVGPGKASSRQPVNRAAAEVLYTLYTINYIPYKNTGTWHERNGKGALNVKGGRTKIEGGRCVTV